MSYSYEESINESMNELITDFEYPFNFTKCSDGDDIEKIYIPIPIKCDRYLTKIPIDMDDLVNFTKKINDENVLYIRPGENDGPAWLLVARIKNIYIFYNAWCDSTGFDCRGGISLYASYDHEYLIDNALTIKEAKCLGIDYDNLKMPKNPIIDDLKYFKYPFSYTKCSTKKKLSKYFKPIVIYNSDTYAYEQDIYLEDLEDLIDFTDKINDSNVIKYKTGIDGNQLWCFIAEIENLYVYYRAWCDIDGFDTDGEISLYVSSSLHNIKKYAFKEKNDRILFTDEELEYSDDDY